MTLLTRSFDVETDGRNVIGLAYYYDRASKVTDDGRRFYLEAFAKGAETKTLKQRAERPLFKTHRRNEDPIGITTFEPIGEGLLFRARMSKTRDGDEALELVNDGAMRSASVGFVSFQDLKRTTIDGPVIVRAEIGIRELSLVPTGFGQHAGAEVLAVRSEPEVEGTPRLDALRRKLILLAPLTLP